MVCPVNSNLLGAPCQVLYIYRTQLPLCLYWSLNIPFCASGQLLLPVAHLKPQRPPTNSILLSASCFIKTGCTLLSFLIPASFTGCMVWREHPWQSPSPALRVLLPLIALNFPSISYPFFGYSFNSSLTTSIHYASLWLLLFFFFPSLLTPLFLPPILTPTSNNKNYSLIPRHMKSFHWISDMLFPFPGSPNSTLSPSACQLLLILHVPRQAQFSLLSLCLDDLLLGSHSTTLISFKRKKNQMTNQMTLYLVVYMSVPPWTMSSGMAENTPLIWEPCFLSSIWLEQGFNNWLLSVCFTHWGHRERFEENSPPNSSTTQPWDFYKWFLLPCGCIFFFFIKRSYSSKVTIIFFIL